MEEMKVYLIRTGKKIGVLERRATQTIMDCVVHLFNTMGEYDKGVKMGTFFSDELREVDIITFLNYNNNISCAYVLNNKFGIIDTPENLNKIRMRQSIKKHLHPINSLYRNHSVQGYKYSQLFYVIPKNRYTREYIEGNIFK